jgi:hypothetical protein
MQWQCVLSCLESSQEEHGRWMGGNDHPRLDDPSFFPQRSAPTSCCHYRAQHGKDL